MKLVVLVPSADYLINAGARIRYYRLLDPLKKLGIHLSLVDIGDFDVESSEADFLLISKCHDARAHLAAIAAGRHGIAVGVDLFDDYFSQRNDARMVRFRRWLSQLAPLLSFALASTPAMAEVLHTYRTDLPVKVVKDPAALHGAGMAVASAARIAAKFDEAANDQRLRFAWFGIGDNPHFPVGLHDLAAFSADLAAIAGMTGLTVELNLLTNPRALTAHRLAMISALPIETHVDEWTEAAEALTPRNQFCLFSSGQCATVQRRQIAQSSRHCACGRLPSPVGGIPSLCAIQLADLSRCGNSGFGLREREAARLVRASFRTDQRPVEMGIGGCRSKGVVDVFGDRCRAPRCHRSNRGLAWRCHDGPSA